MKLSLLCLLVFSAFLLSGCVQNSSSSTSVSSTTSAGFTCENDNTIQSRGYVLLMGLGGHHKDEWDIAKRYMEMDPKAKLIAIYDQDETTHLPEISAKFLSDMQLLLAAHPVEELVIFGSSAGGVTSSYSIARLNFSGPVALHTLASPLKGYGFSGIKENFLGNRSGYHRDIAIGLQPFDQPPSNVKVYHHKTIHDTVLVDYYCRGFEFLCNAVEIQNNNIAGSKEFFYPQFDHDTIMPAVIKKVLKCYNSNLTFPEDSVNAEGIGAYCAGVEECSIFCRNSRGICDQYCTENPSSQLCNSLFGRNS